MGNTVCQKHLFKGFDIHRRNLWKNQKSSLDLMSSFEGLSLDDKKFLIFFQNNVFFSYKSLRKCYYQL